jgi:hypothetical protein
VPLLLLLPLLLPCHCWGDLSLPQAALLVVVAARLAGVVGDQQAEGEALLHLPPSVDQTADDQAAAGLLLRSSWLLALYKDDRGFR